MSNPLRIVVTGAAGHLGNRVATDLAALGYRVTGFDVVAPKAAAGWQFVTADLCQRASYQPLLADADLVVHCASIHPWKPYTDEQYMDCNVKGTWQLYAAIAEAGLDRVVLTSSIAASGMSGIPMADWPVTEDQQYTPRDLYSYTKFCQEECARLYAVQERIRTIALRPPAFMPADPVQTLFRLTGCFALVDDIASAHLAAVRALAERPKSLAWFEACFITNDLPYTAADTALLEGKANPSPLVRKYWPELWPWLVEKGYQGGWLPAFYDNRKAKRLLGWQPVHNVVSWHRHLTGGTGCCVASS